MSTVISKITNLKASVSSNSSASHQSSRNEANHHHGKSKVVQSKSMNNLHSVLHGSVPCSTLSSNATGSENFILSSQVHEIGILRRALVAAREGDLNTLQVSVFRTPIKTFDHILSRYSPNRLMIRVLSANVFQLHSNASHCGPQLDHQLHSMRRHTQNRISLVVRLQVDNCSDES